MAYDVEVVRLEPQPVASIVVPGIVAGAVGAALHGALPDVFSHLEANGVAMIGPPFARYHAAAPPDGQERFDLEVGIPVGGPFPETDTVKARELPGGDAIAVVHVGSYDRLPEAVAALAAWRQANGRASAAYWEIYEDDPSTTPVDQLRTRIVEPLVS